MNRLYFWGFLSCFAVVWSGCAESAIPMHNTDSTDDDSKGDSKDDSDSTGESDSKDDSNNSDDEGKPTGRVDASTMDGGRKDAAVTTDARVEGATDAGKTDAGSTDAGKTDSGASDAGDAGKTEDAGASDAGKDAGRSDGGGLTCVSSQTLCDGKCVNTSTDEANCGSCGNVCPSSQVCESKRCNAPVGPFMVPANCTKKSFGGHGYGFCSSARSWGDARSECIGAGLDLAIVDNKDENDFLRGNGDSWIGANDQLLEGNWVQVSPGNSLLTTGSA
ncbi:MAG TPA: hypothetical protein VI299_26695, partial [Polyangiales bacterium]